MRLAISIPLLLLAATPAFAQDPATDPGCMTVRPAFPAGFGGWSVRTPLTAGASTRSAPVLVIGRGVDLRLTGAERTTPAAAPQKPTEPGATAGLALFQVTRAGTYRIALGSAAWIDVVRSGKPVASAAHGHGPACTGIRKIVDFRLTPGRYVLQLTGTQAPSVPVLIARAA